MPELFSNAPSAWPKVRLEGLIPSLAPEAKTANSVAFATTIEATFRAASGGLQVLEANVERLTREGVIEVPLRVRAADGEYDVFFYPVADEQSAAHFAGVSELARKWGRLRPVYYSSQTLPDTNPSPLPITQTDRLYLTAAQASPKGQYAMWWANVSGERFHQSSTFDLVDRIYRELNGLEMRAYALILREIGMIHEEYEFTSGTMTDTTVEIPLEGPEGIPMIATYSQQRGLRFHFHMTLTSPEARDLFLNLFLMRIKAWKQEANLEHIKRLDSPSYIWWRELGKRLRFTSGEQSIQAVGSVKR
ncbi:MAG: hypothetical protein SFU83_11305 [Meiothermus sp.]|nr:hypothetical protein [Meiothermus sp.]